jgi:hypothetical protein
MLDLALFGTAPPTCERSLPDIVNNLLALSQQVVSNKQQAHDRENNSGKQISTVSEGLVQAKTLMVRRTQTAQCPIKM